MTATEAREIVAAIKPNYCLTGRQVEAQRVVAAATAKSDAEAKAAADRRANGMRGGGVPQVRRQTSLRMSYSLVWSGVGNLPGSAEIWNQRGEVIYRGTLAACREETARRGLAW